MEEQKHILQVGDVMFSEKYGALQTVKVERVAFCKNDMKFNREIDKDGSYVPKGTGTDRMSMGAPRWRFLYKQEDRDRIIRYNLINKCKKIDFSTLNIEQLKTILETANP